MKIPPRFFAPRALLIWLAGAALAVAQTYNVTDLGALSGAPTYATAISESGVISGYAQPDANSARAWIWKTGFGFTDVGSFGGADNRAMAVGLDGRLYGYSQNGAGVARGFVFDSFAMTLTDLGSLVAGDAVSAEGVNGAGTVVGTTTTGGATLGFKLSGGTMTVLGTLAGADLPATSAAYDINDAGRIVGVASWIGGGTRAFRTDAGGAVVSLGTLGANDSVAMAINAGGQVAGWSVNAANATHAFLFNDAGGLLDLGVLAGGVESRAYGINDAGEVVGASEDAAGKTRAFLWMPGGLRDLNELIPPNSGWVLREARDTNNAGDIVGYGTINGAEHAFLLERFDGPDTFAPVAVATVMAPGQGATYTQVAVKFWDNEKVVSATARAVGAIRITGPNGYDAPGTAFTWTTNDSQIVNVSFNVPAPGGSWTPDDNGTYEVRVAAAQVSDIAGNKMAGGVIGTFTIGLQTTATFSMTIPATATAGVAVNLAVTASSSYPSAAGDVFTYTIDWDGDGAGAQTVAGVSGALLAHTFTSIGTHTVRAHATDPHGVVSSERTATVVVANNAAVLQTSDVPGLVSAVYAGGTAAVVKDGTMYFFGLPLTVNDNTGVTTWNYITPTAGFVTQPDNLDNGPIVPAGAGVDSRGRTIFYGGGEAGAAGTSATSYTIAGGAGGGVAAMPAAVVSGPSTSDNLSRLYFLNSAALYRYTSGTTGSGAWATLPAIPGNLVPSCVSFDGGDRLIAFVGTNVWAYSISGNAWTPLGPAPVAPSRTVLGADGLVYLLVGAQMWAFDPALNTVALAGTLAANQSGAHLLKGSDGWLYLVGSGNVERFDTRATTTLAPRLSSVPAGTTLVQGTAWNYQIAASGKPRPTFALVRGPAGMNLNTTTGLVAWTPVLAQAGPQTAVVRATNSAGLAEQIITFNVLTVAPDITAPTAPINVTVLPPPQLTTNSADVTWSPSTDNVGVTGYGIYRRHSVYRGRGSTYRTVYSLVGSTASTSYHFANLPLCSTSVFYIAALDAAGNRSAYAPVTIRVICIPAIAASYNYGASSYAIEDEPFTGTGFTGTGNPVPTLTPAGQPAGSVWHATAANTGYFTWTPAFGQAADANYAPPTQPAVPGTATFTLTASNLAPAPGGGTSGAATTQSYTVPVWPKGTDLIPPTPVTALSVDSVTADSCHLAWTPATDNYGIVLQRVTVAHRTPRSRFHRGSYDDHVVTVDLPAGVADVTVTGLHSSTSYVVTVLSRDAAGVTAPGVATGLWSYAGASASFYTRPVPFVVTGGQQTQNLDGSLTMTWPDQGYYWKYTVQCTDSLAPANWQPVPPVAQWPSFYIHSFTITPDPAVPSRFYRVLATPGL